MAGMNVARVTGVSDKNDSGIRREVALVVNRRSRSGASTFRLASRELERQGVRVK